MNAQRHVWAAGPLQMKRLLVIEPREGEFNGSVLDTPAQRWIDEGKQIALR